MFIQKNNYYLYIENTKILDLSLIKKRNKFIIIYRNLDGDENLQQIVNFRKKCNQKGIKLYISNNLSLAIKSGANGLYLSAHNKKIYHGKMLEIIGSAHSTKEINQKLRQGCKRIIISRLFKTDYKNKPSYLGVVKFNLMDNNYNVIFHKIHLGGIRLQNLNKLKTVRSEYFAILSEVKKKPAIIRRLF